MSPSSTATSNAASNNNAHLPPHVDEDGYDATPAISGENDLRKVHIIVTGGTIGMKKVASVYEPTSGFLERTVASLPPLHDASFVRTFQGYPNGYCTPELQVKEDGPATRIFYTFREFPVPIDSSDMAFDGWRMMCEYISDAYDMYDGFVVVHGTDTMAFSASALSFMLQNLGKPVVFTGAQVSLVAPRSDGYWNFINALSVAGTLTIPEVTVMFNNKLFRGNRVTKQTSRSFDGFHSPSFPTLVDMGSTIEMKPELYLRPAAKEIFSIRDSLCEDVIPIRMSPSLTASQLDLVLSSRVRGIVLQSYGSGNGPSSPDILEVMRRATTRENEDERVIIVNVSQCFQGTVTEVYKAGRGLIEAGVISLGDMTEEAAQTKLHFVLAMDELSYDEKCAKMKSNVAGELTPNPTTLEEDKMVDVIRELPEGVQGSLVCNLIYHRKTEDIDDFLEAHPSLSTRCEDDVAVTPLHVACFIGWRKGVGYLLRKGCSIHAKDIRGRTPLLYAIESKDMEIVHMLKATGATLAQMRDDEIAMHVALATKKGDADLVRAWMVASDYILYEDYLGHTALDVAESLADEAVKDDLKFALTKFRYQSLSKRPSALGLHAVMNAVDGDGGDGKQIRDTSRDGTGKNDDSDGKDGDEGNVPSPQVNVTLPAPLQNSVHTVSF